MAARSWVTGLAAATVFLVVGVEVGLAQVSGTARPAAVVNGEAIALAEVDAVLKLVPQPPAPPNEEQRRQMRRDALEMLIDDVLMRQFLSKWGRPVAPQEVEQRMGELVQALKAQNHTLPEFLSDTAQTETHLRLDILKKLQWDDYINRNVNEAVLKRYYQENKDFYDQVKVKASHVLLRVSPRAPEAEAQAARTKLADLHRQIVAGQLDFAEAARKYSQCASASQGGDIGYFPRKWAVDEMIARTAFALKVGEVSDVIQTDYGYHLIKVTDRKPGQPSDYQKVKDEVRENYAMELWQNVLVQQRKAAQIEINLP
jgi:peptidyl-prolyl cis-trans isomerase C